MDTVTVPTTTSFAPLLKSPLKFNLDELFGADETAVPTADGIVSCFSENKPFYSLIISAL